MYTDFGQVQLTWTGSNTWFNSSSSPSDVNTLIVPFGVAVVSALVLLLHGSVVSRPVKHFLSRIRARATTEPLDAPDTTQSKVTDHIDSLGGRVIFFHMVLRAVCSIAVFILSVVTLLLERPRNSASGSYDILVMVGVPITLFYASALALSALCIQPGWSRVVTRHYNLTALVTFCVYLYRDVFPLLTFTLSIQDPAEGKLLWAKIALLGFIGVVLPLGIPRAYVPIDPNNPSPSPSLEQTSSIFSLVTFFYLDPLVILAYRVPQLAFEQLPPLADFDHGHYLKRTSFPHMDVFSGAPKRHLFWGLLLAFRWEYAVLILMIELHVVFTFASPIGLNRLLAYVETRGEDAFIRPYVWILFLLFGPVLASIAIQWYLFTAAKMISRLQALLTELVFEHSLRIRMKASVSEGEGSKGSATPSTPDDASLSEAESTLDGGASTSNGDDSTVQASNSSTNTNSSKIKAEKESAKNAPHPDSATSNLVGKINNLVSTDLENVVEARDFFLIVAYVPVQIALCIVFLHTILGWSAFVGLAILIAMLPIPGLIAKLTHTVQENRLKKTDARVQSVTEIMNVLRMVKLFGWETRMDERITSKREDEMVWIKYRQLLDLLNGVVNFIIPVITMITTYAVYVLTIVMKGELTASIVFSSMAVFEMLQQQLHEIFNFITTSIAGKVSVDRINEFLKNTELIDAFAGDATTGGDLYIPADEEDTSTLIGFQNASFTWSSDVDGSLTPSKRKFLLRIDDRLILKPGRLNLIVGPTGSGKTSLLMALLGEMHFIPIGPEPWYNLPRTNGIAYAAQESWVQNETIKANIIFGAPFDEDRYKQVIYQCGLERDISLFDAGDETEVGEKGLTLSGGQKARVTLARHVVTVVPLAIYSTADIILLDDVLAALDVHTAKWIVEKCFAGDLVKGRTIILVTHNVALTQPVADFVVSVKDGRISAQGSACDVLGKTESLKGEATKDEQTLKNGAQEIDDPADRKSSGKLIVAEEMEEGHVGWPALTLYFNAMGGNHVWMFFLSVIGGFTLVEMFNVSQTWWIGYWASQYEQNGDAAEISVFYYLGIYSSFTVGAATCYTLTVGIFVYGILRASRSLHYQLIQSILGTTLRWLDTTPTSRVIARCTQDIRAVDGPLAMWFQHVLDISMTLIVKFCAIVIVTPVFLVPSAAVAIAGGICGQVYIKAQLGVKRQMANAKAPVLAHFGAAIAGLTSVRAYGAQEAFINESLRRIDKYTRATRVFYDLNRWISIRIDSLGGIFAAALATYLVYFKDQEAGSTGFSLNLAIGFSGLIIWWVRILNMFEVQGNSLERIQQYVEIEQEPKATKQGEPPAYWPASGDLRVENLSARYSLDGPKVLHDISLHVKSGERVGVVGRTGSGKSSLTLSLLRCIFTEGNVYYDGLPTSSINLDALRTSITIIPQMPELLSGSLRQNLDPFDQYDDASLNDALRAAGLFSLQDETEEGRVTLDSTISSGGGNLSVGQRQIIALARAIVRGSKLLILDEATSAIDYKTDSIIQSSLRHELKGDVTLITVAHRLQTIMDADKIMVLDAGNLVEFDSPAQLLKNEKGFLRALVDESNDKAALYAMAEGRQ
ncbi:P-loop containing nucleoside triphosphate hydrolase protein [Mucidula mucida]|nr:P-loop containing nucleoside triphosphate hydrolase protein [Mucidula mucida]